MSTALLAAILPVSMAYGSVSDVNTFFAFLLLAAVSAVQRAARTGRTRWLVVAWLCIGLSAWTRFEAFLLVPGISGLLWPRLRWMVLFTLLSLLPTFFWNYLNYLSSGDPNMIYNAVRADTALAVSRVLALFGFVAAAWQSVTFPLMVLGVMGILRALRCQRGREWLGLLVLHLGALVAATVLSGTGNQPRYLILVAAILAYYAGVAIAGIAAFSRRAAIGVLVTSLIAIVLLPLAYADHRSLWIRQSPGLRAVMDCVSEHVTAGTLFWISDEASFMFPSHTGWPIQRYHHASRTDSDIRALSGKAQGTDVIWLCHNQTDYVLRQVQELLSLWEDAWIPVMTTTCADYTLIRLAPRKDTTGHSGE
jgi:4-amino-4-deoxy-L-arabinose transferase-like glycosyltransferase